MPFRWGNAKGHVFCEDIARVYEEQVLWHKNISPPSREVGRDYIKEHTQFLQAYKDRTPLEECVALLATMVIPGLLLQKPHAKAGAKEFIKHFDTTPGVVESWQDQAAAG